MSGLTADAAVAKSNAIVIKVPLSNDMDVVSEDRRELVPTVIHALTAGPGRARTTAKAGS
jgi:hypothetical protein